MINRAVLMTALAAVTCGIAACACPTTGSYNNVPYDGSMVGERTAGEGVVKYGKCNDEIVEFHRKAPEKKAEQVFVKSQHK